jgi:hypothetical protein
MSYTDDCPYGRSQHLTRESLFRIHAARVYVFDRIKHGTALEILYKASVALQKEALCETILEHQWREYFGLPVMSLYAVANYYGLKKSELKFHIRKNGNYSGGLFESGMLVLRDFALESVREIGYTVEIQQCFVLLPPRAVLRLCLFLPATPVVVATVKALWEYVLAERLNESILADWLYTANQHVVIDCERIEKHLLIECLAEAKERNLYPYIQHFGHQTCFEAWASLFAYEGEFPPSRGTFYIEKQGWLDKVSNICLRG